MASAGDRHDAVDLRLPVGSDAHPGPLALRDERVAKAHQQGRNAAVVSGTDL